MIIMLKSEVYFQPFSPKYHDLTIGDYGLFQIWDLSIPSERARSKLSKKS